METPQYLNSLFVQERKRTQKSMKQSQPPSMTTIPLTWTLGSPPASLLPLSTSQGQWAWTTAPWSTTWPWSTPPCPASTTSPPPSVRSGCMSKWVAPQRPNITPFIELKQYWLSFATKVTIGGQVHLCFSNQVWYVWFTTNWLQILFLLTLVLLLVSSCVTFQVKKEMKKWHHPALDLGVSSKPPTPWHDPKVKIEPISSRNYFFPGLQTRPLPTRRGSNNPKLQRSSSTFVLNSCEVINRTTYGGLLSREPVYRENCAISWSWKRKM